MPEIRPFRRADREQLTALVNAHVQAVVPGVVVPVAAVLAQLEREPDEYVVDPWVVQRETLVAVARDRVVAAALLHRYATGPQVSAGLRGAGEIRWLVHRPEHPTAGDRLATACLAVLARWGVTRRHADGALPAPGVLGVPEQWPHVRAVLQRAGFVHDGHTEVVLLGEVERLAAGPAPELAGVTARRTVGGQGVRISACRDDEVLGHVEVDTDLTGAGRLSRLHGWADVGDLVAPSAEVAAWLYARAAHWLRLAGVHRLLDYAGSTEPARLALARAAGLAELTRTARGWTHR